MRGCNGFFMGNSLSDPKTLLIPFIGNFAQQGADHIHFSGDLIEKPLLFAGLLIRV
jgi:hypothetical protein